VPPCEFDDFQLEYHSPVFGLPSQIPLFKNFLHFKPIMQLSFIFVLVAIASSSLAAPVPGQGMSTLRAQEATTKHGLSIQHEATHDNSLIQAAHLQGAILKQAHSNAKQSIGRRSPSPGQAMSTLRNKQDKPKQAAAHQAAAAHVHAKLQGAQLVADVVKTGYDNAKQAIGRRSPSPGQGMSTLRAQQDATKHALAQQQAATHANALLTSAQIHAQIMKQGNKNAVHAIGRRSPLPGQGMSSMRSSSKDTKGGNAAAKDKEGQLHTASEMNKMNNMFNAHTDALQSVSHSTKNAVSGAKLQRRSGEAIERRGGSHVASKHAAANAYAQHAAGSYASSKQAAANSNAVQGASAKDKVAHQVSTAVKHGFSDMDSAIF
jgi:hypothetical protein